uniref:Uncharacterized protein n=1 Tax=Romanomermis culicivorax TaxID=13658 RepID=A0A915JMJ7_ROMCU
MTRLADKPVLICGIIAIVSNNISLIISYGIIAKASFTADDVENTALPTPNVSILSTEKELEMRAVWNKSMIDAIFILKLKDFETIKNYYTPNTEYRLSLKRSCQCSIQIAHVINGSFGNFSDEVNCPTLEQVNVNFNVSVDPYIHANTEFESGDKKGFLINLTDNDQMWLERLRSFPLYVFIFMKVDTDVFILIHRIATTTAMNSTAIRYLSVKTVEMLNAGCGLMLFIDKFRKRGDNCGSLPVNKTVFVNFDTETIQYIAKDLPSKISAVFYEI